MRSAATRLTASLSCACTNPSPSPSPSTIALLRLTRRVFMVVSSSAWSERKPQQHVGRTVGGGITTEAIVIAAAAVELGIGRELHREFGIEPRQVIQLCYPAFGVRAATRAGDHAGRRPGRIQQRVGTAGGGKVADRCAVLAAVIIGP